MAVLRHHIMLIDVNFISIIIYLFAKIENNEIKKNVKSAIKVRLLSYSDIFSAKNKNIHIDGICEHSGT